MRVAALKLLPFRCHPALSLAVPLTATVVGVVGPNGSGKTSVLEALSLLAPGRGLTGQELRAHLPTPGGKAGAGWGVHVTLAGGQAIGQQYTKGTRKIVLEGEPLAQDDLASLGSIVMLTPHTDFLFSGPPEGRRRWLDDATTAWHPTHAQAVSRYRLHRQARLKILAGGYLQGDWLEAEERLAAEWGVKLLQGRVAYLTALAPYMPTLTLALHGTALEVLAGPDPIAALQGKFARSREIDAKLNRTHAGPNTLDVQGVLLLEEARRVPLAQASSGQHKRALLTWVQAHTQLVTAKRGAPPLVLIDEFAAHLDAPRRTLLLEHLRTLGCQVWLADVELPNLAGVHQITLTGH